MKRVPRSSRRRHAGSELIYFFAALVALMAGSAFAQDGLDWPSEAPAAARRDRTTRPPRPLGPSRAQRAAARAAVHERRHGAPAEAQHLDRFGATRTATPHDKADSSSHPKAAAKNPAAPHGPNGESTGKAQPPADAKKLNKAADAKASPAAAATGDEDVEAVESVEDVESADVVDGTGTKEDSKAALAKAAMRAEGYAQDQGFTPNKLAAHLHPALVHLPIAWIMLWAFFEFLSVLFPHPWLLGAGAPLGILTTLSFGPAIWSGLRRLDELSLAQSGYDAAPALLHRNLLFIAIGIVVVATLMRLLQAHKRGRGVQVMYRLLVFVAFFITAWSAHLGGSMVYGDDFLPF